MKTNTFLVCIVTLALGSQAVMSQGTVLFENNSAGLVRVGSSPPMLVETGLGRVQLAYAPVNDPGWIAVPPYSVMGRWFVANPTWSLTAPTAPFTAPGIFSGSVLTLDGIAEGEEIKYVVFAWTGLQPTFDEALASGAAVGVSEMFRTYTGTAGNPLNIADSFRGMTIPLLPEPSAATLALLGAGVVLWNRRRLQAH